MTLLLRNVINKIGVCSTALVTIPVVSVLLLVSLAWRTERMYGAFPTYGNPDPKDTPFWIHLNLADMALIATLAASIAALAYTVFVFAQNREKILYLGPTIVIYIAYFWFVLLDPSGIMAWYMD